ncbi:hypothetical protein SAMN05421813_1122 [Daejeonella rubra]|uniref:Uncharacterized protein n=1 Tax=Daejeonella rubra TaxID=990371 RepID=A0A1G9T4I4_9SPHI|nr:hypothetical protein [Daejeonella rubra]SDM42552.1 hypothetical protein SAMN05421813_1122 [Daejeonella rubra]
MEAKRKKTKGIKPDRTDRDESLKEDLNMEINIDDLSFDLEKNSYEMDVIGDDPEYVHHDPYDTAVENGRDAFSDFDEANPTAVNEYDKNASLETDLDVLGMHVEIEEDIIAEEDSFSDTPEDNRDDLDLEGYPKNDRK